MNLAIRGIEANLGHKHADTFHTDLHPDLRADYILANPPFNISQWHRQEEDVRWKGFDGAATFWLMRIRPRSSWSPPDPRSHSHSKRVRSSGPLAWQHEW